MKFKRRSKADREFSKALIEIRDSVRDLKIQFECAKSKQ